MNEKKPEDKLQRAYQSMLDTIRELVDKEGKSLKEATDLAEGKLKAWKELTSEETRNIAKEVKQDLKSFSEVLAQSRATFAKQLTKDASYAKEAALDALGDIVEKTSRGLASFSDLLKNEDIGQTSQTSQTSQTVTTPLAVAQSHELMLDTPSLEEAEHHDHTQWHSDSLLWLDEITLWKKEDQQARQLLDEIQEGLDTFEKAMDDHALAIRAHEVVSEEHEIKIAEAAHDDIAHQDHQDEKRTHAAHAQRHKNMKTRHYQTMVLLKKLHKELSVN